jgi:CO/xanthine dehydrogenase Mo-binding subunit
VKFVEDRVENMTSCDNHGSERLYDVDLALTDEGEMLSLRVDTVDDYGAYFQYEVGHHGNSMAQVVGPYTIDSVEYDVTAVLTNKCQQGAYRGFGSEVHNFALERVVDAAATELGIDPVDLRRRNLIPSDAFPYKIPGGNVYDSGDYEAVLGEALDLADYDEWLDRQSAARAEGRHIGIGVVTCQERSVFSATEFWFWNDDPEFKMTSTPESVEISIDRTGNVSVILHSPFWGNSPETVATQIVAEELTVDPERISVSYADMQSGLDSTGPGGSRYTVMIAGAIERATGELKQKMKRIAADDLEVADEDLTFGDGELRVRGAPDRSKTIDEIALAAHAFALELPEGVNSGLQADHVYDHPYTTMPSEDRDDLGVFYPIMGHMVHVPVVEVDVETGHVEFLDYTAVHDCGTVVNPQTLAGHVRGGTAQGIATALFEEFKYDDNGQLVTANFTDYFIPTAHEVPDELTVGHVETPSPYTEYGIKGGGEGGRMAAPAAVAAAVEDALAPFDVSVDELPLTPERVASLVDDAGES